MPTRARAESSPADSGRFGIVVVGASAGGHVAMREILRALPASFELPIVLVLHLNPRLPSVLARVLVLAVRGVLDLGQTAGSRIRSAACITSSITWSIVRSTFAFSTTATPVRLARDTR